ncbi:MAG TPA: NAD(P)(+) transhydrogenase (Re/Si-specific) subunit beta [Bacillota bacterium]|nr:NAD(P)(+) transhydrogenase (Re/Si-specific) subunit beta [Bacillota bacterium]
MTQTFYYIISAVLSAVILYGISLMSRVRTAVAGNLLSAGASAVAIILTLTYFEVFSQSTALAIILVCVAIGTFLGLYLARVVKMIQMPEMVGAFNGVGGAASALVGGSAMFYAAGIFELTTAVLAVLVGTLTFTGSFIAAGKLAGMIDGRPVHWRGHQAWINIAILLSLACIVLAVTGGVSKAIILPAAAVFSGFLGIAIAIRVGGADMPITISLLNSLSGVAGAIAGMAIGDILLVSVGGIVGASGLLLTQIMCRAMNSSLGKILQGKTSIAPRKEAEAKATSGEPQARAEAVSPAAILAQAKDVIIVPGYGMALAQAQHLVKKLADALEARGARVRYAIHPVAGRMPGHMNVLLSEADVPYEQLYELEAINDEFAQADACVVVGANDVINPAARDTTDTPISGMPILNADQAKHIIICNYDLKPGYAGVDNPIYSRTEGVSFLLGDAAETLQQLLDDLQKQGKEEKAEPAGSEAAAVLAKAGKVIIVPGYGMALAQAQHLVKRLADELERRGAEVKYAIHPVAGRMPGHMNVLLSEADVPYEQLYELEAINDEFAQADACVVVGANDVINPAARDTTDTPISGMPILNADQAKHIIICNYDLKPGYAGVDNPIYSRTEGVSFLLGDAAETLQQLLDDLQKI